MTAASLVDASLQQPAVVFGSLPPQGRDLDLLVDPAAAGGLCDTLVAQGWVRSGRTLAWFADGTAYATDVVPVDDWDRDGRIASAVFEQSLPIEGFRMLRAPAAHHQVLILARRRAGGMTVTDARRARLRTHESAVWDLAATEAASWGLTSALSELAAELAATGAADAPHPRLPGGFARPRVIALSGLDGAGKSTQAELLKDALTALGFDARVEWTKVRRDPLLDKIGSALRRVLGGGIGAGTDARAVVVPAPPVDPSGEVRNYPDGPPPPPDSLGSLRRRSPALTWLWVLVVAMSNGLHHRRTVGGHGRAVVICDRYVLDTRAHLRYIYGPDRRFRLAGHLVALLSPTPAAAFLLDVTPEDARARKAEQYTTADLARLRQLYREESSRARSIVLSAGRGADELAAEIARLAWLSLAGRR